MSHCSLWTVEPWLPLGKPVDHDGSTSMCPGAHLPERGQEMTDVESFACQEEASVASRCWCRGAVRAPCLSDLSSPMGPLEAHGPQCPLGYLGSPSFQSQQLWPLNPKPPNAACGPLISADRTCREGGGQSKSVLEGSS